MKLIELLENSKISVQKQKNGLYRIIFDATKEILKEYGIDVISRSPGGIVKIRKPKPPTLRELILSLTLKVDSIDKRVDSIDKRVDSIDKRVDSIDKRVDSIDKRLMNVEADVKAMKNTPTMKRELELKCSN